MEWGKPFQFPHRPGPHREHRCPFHFRYAIAAAWLMQGLASSRATKRCSMVTAAPVPGGEGTPSGEEDGGGWPHLALCFGPPPAAAAAALEAAAAQRRRTSPLLRPSDRLRGSSATCTDHV